MHLLAADDLMAVAQLVEQSGGEFLVADLVLLQAQDIGRFGGEELFDDRDPGASVST